MCNEEQINFDNKNSKKDWKLLQASLRETFHRVLIKNAKPGHINRVWREEKKAKNSPKHLMG